MYKIRRNLWDCIANREAGRVKTHVRRKIATTVDVIVLDVKQDESRTAKETKCEIYIQGVLS